MTNIELKILTDKADSLAREYNRTKDSGIRDQWFKLVRSVKPLLEENKKS